MTELGHMFRIRSRFSGRLRRSCSRHAARGSYPGLEALESRELLSTFMVTSLGNAGPGSLRQAIIASNQHPGPDTIDFEIAGTIRVRGQSLPVFTGPTTIDGTSAPKFNGSPVVTVNFQGTQGLRFAAGSSGSTVKSLSLVKAGKAGITISRPNVTVQGNFIGMLADGKTVAGNRGDGVQINRSSHGDLIGQSDPVSSIDYNPTQYVVSSDNVPLPVSGWTGIRESAISGRYLITGSTGDTGLLYEGPITANGGTGYVVSYPGSTSSNVYGPDDLGAGELRLVGTYGTGTGDTQGFIFQGTTADLATAGDYATLDYPGAQDTDPSQHHGRSRGR